MCSREQLWSCCSGSMVYLFGFFKFPTLLTPICVSFFLIPVILQLSGHQMGFRYSSSGTNSPKLAQTPQDCHQFRCQLFSPKFDYYASGQPVLNSESSHSPFLRFSNLLDQPTGTQESSLLNCCFCLFSR